MAKIRNTGIVDPVKVGGTGTVAVENSDDNPTKTIRFHGKEAKEFVLTKDSELLKCTLYRECKFYLVPRAVEVDIDKAINALEVGVNRVLNMMKVPDVIIYDSDTTKKSFVVDQGTSVVTLLVPHSETLEVILQSFHRMMQILSTDASSQVTYKMRSKNIARIVLTKNEASNENVFLKGFVAVSHEKQEENRGKNYLKGITCIDLDVGLTYADASRFNRHNMSITKLNVIGPENEEATMEDGTPYPYYPEIVFNLPFRKAFNIISYELDEECPPEKGFRAMRDNITISLRLKPASDGSNKKVATGVYVTKTSDELNVTTLRQVFTGPKNKYLLTKDAYVGFDKNSFENKTFEKEIDNLDNWLMKIIERDDYTAPVSDENVEEKPKKTSTKKPSKKKAVEDSESSAVAVEVGSLVDVMNEECEDSVVENEATE